MIPPLPHIKAMQAYALADLKSPPGKRLISLSQNECLRPPSPNVTRAAEAALAEAQLYPDPNWNALRGAISAHYGVPADQILLGNGSLELIGCLTRAYADADNAVLVPRHSYPFFRTAAQFADARVDLADEVDLAVSVDHLLQATAPDTRIVFVANPGNPTGTRISQAKLRRLRAGLDAQVLLVIDEAYGEFADHLNEPVFDMVGLGNTVILRSFSKAYGLAGFRVGWGLFPPDIANNLRKLMNPNNLPAVSQAAAMAAVEDPDYMRETCVLTGVLRQQICARLVKAGFAVKDSFTNFLLIRFKSGAQAQKADAALRAEGIYLRLQSGAGLGHCLRMTIGGMEDNQIAVEALTRWAEKEKI